MKQGWWYRASTEDRLAQVDAAIELGMTARQCAMNCGCANDDIRKNSTMTMFAVRHGRKFSGDESTARHNARAAGVKGRMRRNDLDKAKQAYLSGDNVDLWSVK